MDVLDVIDENETLQSCDCEKTGLETDIPVEQSGPDNIVDLVDIRQTFFDEPPLNIGSVDRLGPLQPLLSSLYGPNDFRDLAAEDLFEVEVAISTVPLCVAGFAFLLAHRGGGVEK